MHLQKDDGVITQILHGANSKISSGALLVTDLQNKPCEGEGSWVGWGQGVTMLYLHLHTLHSTECPEWRWSLEIFQMGRGSQSVVLHVVLCYEI